MSKKISRRVNYEPSERIYEILEQHRKRYKIDGFKETIEDLILRLRGEVINRTDDSLLKMTQNRDLWKETAEEAHAELRKLKEQLEKPAETRGGDNGTVPIEQQSPSSALPQQAQQPFKAQVCAKNYKFPTEGTCDLCSYNEWCNYSTANTHFKGVTTVK